MTTSESPPPVVVDQGREEIVGTLETRLGIGQARIARLLGLPIEVSAQGSRVRSMDGAEYLDCGGYSVFLLGHRHPVVLAAVERQLATQPMSTRLLVNPVQVEAADKLAGRAPEGLERVVFTTSGAEAVEVALKLGRANGRRRVIAAVGGFHGKSLGALTVTSRERFRSAFHPLLPDVDHVTFGDTEALAQALRSGAPATVLLEPIQAEAGVQIPAPAYLPAVERLCRSHGAILVVDEIQTGLGRTGSWWALDEAGIRPDVVLTGKALGGGIMPVGAVLATPDVFAPFDDDPLLHTSTFAGNQLASAAVAATVDVIADEQIIERADQLGRELLSSFQDLVDRPDSGLAGVRGKGLLIGLDFEELHHGAEFLEAMLDEHVVVSYPLGSDTTVRLSPPAILTPQEVEWLTGAVERSAKRIGGGRS